MARLVLHGLDGVYPPIVARVSGDPGAVREASAGLPDGPATPEAIAVRIRRSGGTLVWGDPVRVGGTAALVRLCRARGASSPGLLRADPSLLTELQLGSWFDGKAVRRLLRRAWLAARVPPSVLRADAADVAFWSGVRQAATAIEWQRLTRSSYVVLYYHRIAGDRKPGQERLDLSPKVFERQVRWLRRLRFRPLGVDELVAFHTEPEATLPRRAVVISADDGFLDAVLALRRHGDLRPIVFVATAAVGQEAPWEWADGEPIASWSELRDFAASGGLLGSHARTHVPLPELDAEALAAELTGSWQDLQQQVSHPSPVLAYPHGRNDEVTRAAAAAAGYVVAFSTAAGRNSAGSDRYGLRRIGPKEWDGALAFAWKAFTGEAVPWSIERRRLRAHGIRVGDREQSSDNSVD